jgi:hypothetical protein
LELVLADYFEQHVAFDLVEPFFGFVHVVIISRVWPSDYHRDAGKFWKEHNVNLKLGTNWRVAVEKNVAQVMAWTCFTIKMTIVRIIVYGKTSSRKDLMS